MPAYYHGKPPMAPARNTPRFVQESCQRVRYADGMLHRCGAPTKGRTYCDKCQMHLITLTDRKPQTQTQRAKNHPWTEEGIQRAQRAKRSA